MGAAIEASGVVEAVRSTLEAFLADHELLADTDVIVGQRGQQIRIEIDGFVFCLVLDDPAPAPFDLSLLPAEPFTTLEARDAIDPTSKAVTLKQMARALIEAGYLTQRGVVVRFWRRPESKS